jgi:amino acid adenylation domain-containing protein/non-ribosomal peptide synthase protein (TIGR01720 family)
MQAEYGLGADDRVLQKTPSSFDVSVWEFCWPLIAGATLVVAKPGGHGDAAYLAQLIQRERVTTVHFVPPMLRAFLSEPSTARCGTLRRVICSGEALPAELAAEFRRTLDIPLHNLYGPTEASVDVTSWESTSEDPLSTTPIGRPVWNTRVYVLDANLRPVPIGVSGELYLAGAQLARGYLNRPGLTAERFGSDPFGPAGSRMYRTGDLVRWSADGALEFLGRTDDQVKVRGFRIELGEIETVLARHESVNQAVVVARDGDAAGQRRLVAYVVPGAAGATTGPDPELRSWLKQRLPDYMVPSAFVLLDRLPLTPSGKVDRRRLPDPQPELASAYVAPRTDTERALARIWSEVLGVERVGVEDNFFGLGGDSILSIQVVSRARQAGLLLTAKDVFLHQTISELGAIVEVGSAPETIEDLVVGPAPLIPIQHWFFDTLAATANHFTMSMLVELGENVDAEVLAKAVDAVVRHHDALRMRFEQVDGEWRQSTATAWPAVFEVCDLSGLDDDSQRIAKEEAATAAQSGLDLVNGPLLRVLLFTFGAGRRPQLFLTIHHLVVDGVSWRILLADLETAYGQSSSARPVDLGPKTTSYLQWARLLSEDVRSGSLDGDLAYWTGVSGSARADIPVDHTGPNTTASARAVSVRLGRADTDALLHQVPGVYRTQVNDVLLSALGRVLSRWTGRDRVLVAMEGHGREELIDGVDLSRTVGWFTTQFPVALGSPESSNWGDSLKSVKEQLRLVPARGLSYEALRYLSAPESPAGVLRDDPVPRVCFNYHGQWDVAAAEDGFYRASGAGIGQDHAPTSTRTYLLDVIGVVENGELELSWSYSDQVHDEGTVRGLAEEMVRGLREIVEFCAGPVAGGCTPSDFPLVGLSQRQVDRVAGDGRGVEDVYPLTPMQAGMVFHSLVDADSGAYVDQIRVRLSGVADPGALGVAWQRVVDRTPVLRSSVVWDGVDEPVQVVRRRVVVPITYRDWRGLSGPDRDRELRGVLAGERSGVVLSAPPLLRVVVARVAGDEVLLVWTWHHVLLDGWSLGLVFAEVCEQYAAIVEGREPELVARRPFRDYLQWLGGRDVGEAEGYWRGLLSGFGSPTGLPFDRVPVEAHRAESSGSVRVEFPVEESARLQEVARGNGLTLNTLVQGAWGLLLSRYCGEDDVVFGTTVAGRPADLPGVESMVGMFINTVPTRVRVESGLDVASWLRGLQVEQAESRRFDFVSLAQLQSWSELPAGATLFDSVVVFENYPIDEASAEQGLQVDNVEMVDTTSFPLTLTAALDDRLALELDYDPALFDGATAKRLAGHLRLLLAGIAEDADRAVSDLPMLTEAEIHRVVVEWNDTALVVPGETFPEAFEAQVARTPDATAVVFRDAWLSFADLDARANKLARHLAGLGVGPERVVALALPRSVEMVVALLAVWKVGGVYLPVDPGLPADRIEFMLRDAMPAVVVTTRDAGTVREAMPAAMALLAVDEPGLPAVLDSYADSDLTGVPLHPESSAYIIYTSGSTGRPKGVVVEHRNLANLLFNHRSDFLAAAGARRLRAALTAVFSFDTSLEGLVLMVDGHELHVLDDDARLDPRALVDYVVEHRIDFLDLTPSYLEQLVPAGLLTDERHHPAILLLGGEELSEPLWRQLAAATDTAGYNFYGPTECTVDALSCRVTDFDRPAIGRPLRNLQAYILDDRLQPVPIGVPGGLYLAGDQVARGYLNRPGLTAERFVVNPFGPPGSRMYDTGDLARWTAEGCVEYLGRTDEQVKIRGHRIEPGEIEAALRTHPGLAQVAVIAREDQPGLKRLIAYAVPAIPATDVDRAEDTGEVSPAAVRAHAATILPDYMVPAAVVILDQLPLTPNGKLNRKALPAPDFGSGATTTSQYIPPRTGTERTLAGIWADVLRIEHVGINDNFFELGGDSILSIQVVSRLRAAFAVELSPRVLFSSPTIAGLANLVASATAGDTDALSVIPVLPRDGEMPLSFAQQRLWFLHEFEPDSDEYVTPFALRLRGELDVDAMNTALTALVARHEALRTTFDEVDGHGVQVVHEPTELLVPVLDLSSLPDKEREAELTRVLARESTMPFDLRGGPLLRPRLVELAAHEHVLTLSMHHIVTDGWSTGVIIGELSTLYAAAVRGDEPALPALPLQYADFAAWQRDRLSQTVVEEQLGYWRRQLADVPPMELPTDHARPAVRTSAGAVHEFAVPAEVTARLKDVGRHRDSTLFMTLVAACQLLFGRWSGQDDVAVGTVTSGRERAELEGLVGFFVNTLVLRNTVRGDRAFTEFLDDVRGTVLDAFANQDVPFERLVDDLQPSRDTSRTPLFQAMVVLQNLAQGVAGWPGLEVEELASPIVSASFDIMVEFIDDDEGLSVVMTYNTGLFDQATVERMAGQLELLLQGIADDAGRAVSDLPMLTEAESRQVLVEWNDTGRDVPTGALPTLFAQQVRRTPEATAVVADGVSLTYAELDARSNRLANRLANRLVRLGAGPECPVGVLMTRSIGLVIAELAVVKAGGAYLPVDVRAPAERMRLLLAEAGVSVLLTDALWEETAGSVHSGETLIVDDDPAYDDSDGDPADPGVAVDPDQLAYVMFTSGSTGTPKGVGVRHRDVAELAFDRRFEGGCHERVLLHSPSAFDASTYELWVPLLNGGRVVVAPPVELEPDVLRRLVSEHQVTGLWLTSGLFRLVAQDAPESLLGVREVWTGGDVVPAAAVRRVLESCPDLVVVDGYGPTETTTFATSYRMADADHVPDAVPIGRPLDNMRAYVLDRDLRPMPVGVPGELFVAGAGLARGYLRRPGLTAERFVANPFGAAGERMYRTGDVARWRNDATVEFLGRADDQVKVRGFRIEPAEIEVALSRHPEIVEAVVVVRQDESRPKRLVAYLVPAPGSTAPSTTAVREFLGQTLPDYIVPSAYVVLGRLPLTANGKVDRGALPDPAHEPEPERRYVGPSTPTESALTGIWANVLGLGQIGVDDNFFELGGDSILSIQVVARARQAGLRLTTKDLFLHQTIASLAPNVTAVGGTAPEQETIVGPVPLTAIQHWFFATHEGNPHHFNQSVLVELTEELDRQALRRALESLLVHHDALRMRFERVDGQWRQHNGPVETLQALELHDLSEVDPADQPAELDRIADDVHASFDLASGLLLKAVLFELGRGQRPMLFLAAHHLVVDGVSWRILLDDLDTAYQQTALGEAVHLAPKTTSFQTWSQLLGAFVAEGGLDQELDYWAGAVANCAPPVDHPRPATAAPARTISVLLSAEDTEMLLRGAPTAYRTRINDVLLTALAWALSRWSGTSTVSIDLEGHGREPVLDDLDLSRTVGWFTTIFPVALDIPVGNEPDWRALVKSVRRQLRAVPRNGFGFGALRYLGSSAARDRLSAQGQGPQISFNYLGQLDSRSQQDGDGKGPSLYRAVHTSIGQEQDPVNGGPHLLDITGAVEDGRLGFSWDYRSDLHDESTIDSVAADFRHALECIAADCRESTRTIPSKDIR